VIGLAAERFTKNLWTERHSAERPQFVNVRDEADQASYIIERVLENREVGTSLKQQAVVFRTSHHNGPLEVELTRRNIPFVKFAASNFSTARMSRTCWWCCALRKTRVTACDVMDLTSVGLRSM
jgi:DNA helicase II / ATP-dependent DNA helicase PcrA